MATDHFSKEKILILQLNYFQLLKSDMRYVKEYLFNIINI